MNKLTQCERDISAACILRNIIQDAIKKLNENKLETMTSESEVLFRYSAILGMLVMCNNDVFEMIDTWKKDFEQLSAAQQQSKE